VVENLKNIIELFCMAIRMKINLAKSMISLWGIPKMVKNHIIQLFPYNLVDLDVGLKYLGFQLKINLYKTSDWQWLIGNCGEKMNTWCNRWPSRGGRLVLVKLYWK
jgi:hypothetical protein